jgi:hypothetical protein
LKECLELLQELLQTADGMRTIRELASVSEAYQALQLIKALTEGQTVDAIVSSLDDGKVRSALQSIKFVFRNLSGVLLVLSRTTEMVVRALQSPGAIPSPLSSEQIRLELLKLSRLHRKVLRGNDTLGRLFRPLLEKEGAEKQATWDDLEQAKNAFIQKMPGMVLAWQSELRLYGLFPIPDYKLNSKTVVSEENT